MSLNDAMSAWSINPAARRFSSRQAQSRVEVRSSPSLDADVKACWKGSFCSAMASVEIVGKPILAVRLVSANRL